MERSETSTNTPQAADATGLCPKCGGKLTNPEGLGWCPKCGYCRSVEEEAGRVQVGSANGSATQRKPSALGFVEFIEVLKHLPAWVWILMGGMVLITGISYFRKTERSFADVI